MGSAAANEVSLDQIMKLLLMIIGLATGLATVAQAQVSSLQPAQPRWGQTLAITYDSAAGGAKFSAADEIYACVKFSFPDHNENLAALMTKAGQQHHAELKLKDGVAEVAVHFITLSGGWDERAYTTSAAYRADGQPARGSLLGKISSTRYLEFFKQETSLYPDNYSAYRMKWKTASLLDESKAARTINDDLKRLSRLPENAELLYALSFGYLLTGREAESRQAIRRLAANFAASPFAGLAIRDYEEQISNFIAGTDGKGEIALLKQEIIRANPATEFARAVSMALARDQRWPLELSEKVAEAWMAAEPENPQPYFNLALACLNQYQKYDKAVPLIERAIELLLAGRMRLHGDINGKQSEAMLPEAYLIRADLAFRQKQFAEAVNIVKTAEAFARENEFAPYLLEAKILQVMGEKTAAETAFIEAWRRGSQEAEERLKEIYQLREGDLKGFDEYLLGATKGKAANNGWKQAAPSIKLTSLDGQHFDLNALEGKIVVINLWFIGCSPCRKEIPKLNELVKEFSGKPVVFLAPSFDSAETLRDFLKKTAYDYQIVADAEEIIKGVFNAFSFPTHIVINQNGLIEATLVGAGERRPEEVRRLILQMLNSSNAK